MRIPKVRLLRIEAEPIAGKKETRHAEKGYRSPYKIDSNLKEYFASQFLYIQWLFWGIIRTVLNKIKFVINWLITPYIRGLPVPWQFNPRSTVMDCKTPLHAVFRPSSQPTSRKNEKGRSTFRRIHTHRMVTLQDSSPRRPPAARHTPSQSVSQSAEFQPHKNSEKKMIFPITVHHHI